MTPPPCPVTPAEYLPNQPFGAHADSCRLISTQLMHSLQKFLGLFCLHAYQRLSRLMEGLFEHFRNVTPRTTTSPRGATASTSARGRSTSTRASSSRQ